MHIGRDGWESELPLDRSEHIVERQQHSEKQHGGCEILLSAPGI